VIAATLAVARDLLREARARRWTLALAGGVTLLLLVAAFGLELEVVDGALAASRFLGRSTHPSIRAADVALRPLFEGVAYLVFYGGTLLGVLACADFAPALLAPGRIEHLLSLPVRRSELVLGTFLGVELLVLAGALYGGLGLTVIVALKTGVFGLAPVVAAALGAAAFSGVYAVMVAAAMAARSAALSAAAGAAVWILGIVAGNRAAIAPLFEPGLARGLFLAVTAPLPRLSELARQAPRLANGLPLEPRELAIQAGGTLLFAAAALALALAAFERKDF
jgi:Cu-processing system permease protein